ncbi:SDR family NAD(P)-dependent oxidoreductase [Cesiribacter andamanensis]|uniref:NADP-dependent 3-hydroxy acid dehydrogenase YdfG n=1 Tax=Cesiribacter andamanensis AMV16 TaxID=1279009 RepID=M7N8Q7_9BACT|nr:SDR family NAD(P)-dependent oxidoreductase [Cesiribacter andamanensis]EMR03596.1 NADP-dependent 3-hydroxy acid dehydrogenase YdfG [Cesiribacter andamanensis AMV16]
MNNATTTVLITGATSGIGQATARLLGSQGYRLVLCGRRQERLAELQEELSPLCPVHTLQFDVRDRAAVEAALNSLPPDFATLDVLINNAGNAHGLDTLQEGNPDDWDAMLDGNVKGLLYVSKAVLPQMVARRRGHVINIGSIAGKEVYPKGNVYCASKHAVDAISKGMLMDLNPYGVKVSAINPGLVETEFSQVRFKGDDARAAQVYSGLHPLRPEDVAAVILFVLQCPPHVNISDLVLLPTDQASAAVVRRG